MASFSVFIRAICMSGCAISGWAWLGDAVLIATTSVTRSSSTLSMGLSSWGR